MRCEHERLRCCGVDVNPPQPCSRVFPRTVEDGLAVFVSDHHVMFVKVCCAICVTELSDADTVVFETWHDVAGSRTGCRNGKDI